MASYGDDRHDGILSLSSPPHPPPSPACQLQLGPPPHHLGRLIQVWHTIFIFISLYCRQVQIPSTAGKFRPGL
jgi:hypothetical protein